MIIKLEIEKKLPSINDSKDWIVFGNNDFIKIEVLNENFNLRGIENDLLNSSSNDASEIIQKFYLYNDYQKDIFEEYLGKAQNSNFLMISFITLNTDNKNIYANYNQEDSFIKKKKELYNNFERSFNENPDIMIFKTVDDYDFIILNYGDSYTDVYSKFESILKSIHKDNDNSYLSIKDNYRMITSNYEKINKYQDIKDDYEIAFSLELKVKNSEDYYSYFYPEIIKILSNWPEQSYYRNGGKDYIYFNSGLSIKTIFSLYAKNGILNQNNKIRNIAIAASNLHFLSTDNQSIYLKTYQNQNISLFTYDTIKEYLNNYTAEQKNAIKTINDSL